MEPLTLNDLKKGSSLIVEVDGTPYPAEFLSFSGKSQLSITYSTNIVQYMSVYNAL